MKMLPEDARAFIGNYRRLGFLKDNKVMILDEQSNADLYIWNPKENSLKPQQMNAQFLNNSISFYQVADDLYHKGGLKTKN